MNRAIWPVSLLSLSLVIVNCSSDGGGGPPPPPPTPVPTTVVLSQSSVALVFLGQTAQLTATVRDQNGNPISGASVTWSSNNTDVATVSSTGSVTAVGVGSAQVTATSGTLSGNAGVTVTQEPSAADPVEGSGQTGTVGQALASPLVVQINDGGGNPIPDVSVTFAVTQGNGSVSDATPTTAADGRASTMWTLGTGAGTQEVTATAAGVNGVVGTFTATGTSDVANSIALASGNNQSGPTNAPLQDPIVAKVLDQYDNPVEGHGVSFSVTSGGGTLSSESETTDANGEASTVWTMGPIEGQNTAEASSPGLEGDPVTFFANASNLAVSGVSPDPMVEGQSAAITGTGFDVTPENNTVTIGGAPAVVNTATPTLLEITVPSFNCQPARAVDVIVMVGGGSSDPFSHDVSPPAFTTMAVGEQLIIQDPSAFCLQFAAEAADESYLVGVQSTSEVVSSLVPVTLTAVTPSGQTAPPAGVQPATRWAGESIVELVDSPDRQRIRRHREMEARLREFDRQTFESNRSRFAGPSAFSNRRSPVVDSTVAVGDTIMGIRVADISAMPFSCNNFTEITVVVRAVGTTAIWLEDVDNPADGYTGADIDALSAQFDSDIFAALIDEFGDGTDFDNNARAVIVITKEVNRAGGALGFVTACDLFLRDANDMTSNEGEFFYDAAPDPTGIYTLGVYTLDRAKSDAPFVAAHEYVHVIQNGRRLVAGGSFMIVWIAEGQATLGEEIVGHRVEGRATGMNYGLDIAFNRDDTNSIDWYSDGFGDLARYFGFVSGTEQLAEAPHECSFLDRPPDNPNPCTGSRQVYGIPWSLLRWISDHYAATFPGGEPGIQNAIMDFTGGTGYTMLESIIGVPIDSLLAQWAAMLYVDDRITGLATKLTLPSWDMFDVFHGTAGTFRLFETTRLRPVAAPFDDFANSANVRGGSTYYTVVSGSNRMATAVRARDASDAPLPSIMQLWIVRLK